MKMIFKNIALTRKVLCCEYLGLFLILIFIWVDEFFDLPNRLFNAPKTAVNVTESIWESAVIILIFTGIILITMAVTRKLHKLESLIPICSRCKKIRNDDGYWVQVEEYITQYSGFHFSHGLCQDCVTELYPEMADRINEAVSQNSKNNG